MSSEPAPCTCAIKWANGTAVSNSNRDVLPGHKIKLKIDCNSGDLTDIQWTLPGQVFLSFELGSNNATGSVTPVTALSSTQVEFHWRDVGDDRTVKVTFKCNGNAKTLQETFNVKDLTITYPNSDPGPKPKIGALKVRYSAITLFNAEGAETNGIIFRSKVERPSGSNFGQGKVQYVQLINPLNMRKLTSGNCYKYEEGEMVLDEDYPYDDPADDGSTYESSDSPTIPMIGSYVQFTSDISWQMFLMFKPANDTPGGGESQWVSLSRVDWEWSWCAVPDGNSDPNWTVHPAQDQAQTGSWTRTTTHPTWSKVRSTNYNTVNCSELPPCPPED